MSKRAAALCRKAIKELATKNEFYYEGCCAAIISASGLWDFAMCQAVTRKLELYFKPSEKQGNCYDYWWGYPTKENYGERVIALELLACILEEQTP